MKHAIENAQSRMRCGSLAFSVLLSSQCFVLSGSIVILGNTALYVTIEQTRESRATDKTLQQRQLHEQAAKG